MIGKTDKVKNRAKDAPDALMYGDRCDAKERLVSRLERLKNRRKQESLRRRMRLQ